MQNSPELPRFQQVQYAFAAHIRNPDAEPAPADVETRRMQIYAELFYNNIEDFIASTFPILRSLYADSHWHALIRDYFARHHADTPLFHEIPREFLKYLEQEWEPSHEDFPFQLELAHYEWVELALGFSEQDDDSRAIDVDGGLLEGVPVLSSLAWPLQYAYPVHQISPESIPTSPPPQATHLLAYRNAEDNVQFIDMNPVTAQLVHMLKHNNGQSGRQLLASIAEQLQHPQPDVVLEGGAQILRDLRARGVVLGTSKV